MRAIHHSIARWIAEPLYAKFAIVKSQRFKRKLPGLKSQKLVLRDCCAVLWTSELKILVLIGVSLTKHYSSRKPKSRLK
jgi:hypothetical protein